MGPETSSLAMCQIHVPSLYWSDKMDKATVDGEIIILSKFCKGIQDLISDAWVHLSDIGGGKKFANKLPNDFTNDLPGIVQDYSWLEHGPLTKVPHGLLVYLTMECEKPLTHTGHQGDVFWDIAACHNIMDRLATVNGIMQVLIYLITAWRSTKLCNTQIHNSYQRMGLYHPLQNMFILLMQTKTSNLIEKDSF